MNSRGLRKIPNFGSTRKTLKKDIEITHSGDNDTLSNVSQTHEKFDDSLNNCCKLSGMLDSPTLSPEPRNLEMADVIKNLYDSCERERDLKDQLSFAEEEIKVLRQKSEALERENEQYLALDEVKAEARSGAGRYDGDLPTLKSRDYVEDSNGSIFVDQKIPDPMSVVEDTVGNRSASTADSHVSNSRASQVVKPKSLPDITTVAGRESAGTKSFWLGKKNNVLEAALRAQSSSYEATITELKSKLVTRTQENQRIKSELDVLQRKVRKVCDPDAADLGIGDNDTEPDTLSSKRRLDLAEFENTNLRDKVAQLEATLGPGVVECKRSVKVGSDDKLGDSHPKHKKGGSCSGGIVGIKEKFARLSESSSNQSIRSLPSSSVAKFENNHSHVIDDEAPNPDQYLLVISKINHCLQINDSNDGLPNIADNADILKKLDYLMECGTKHKRDQMDLMEQLETYKHELARVAHESKSNEGLLRSRVKELEGDNLSLQHHLKNLGSDQDSIPPQYYFSRGSSSLSSPTGKKVTFAPDVSQSDESKNHRASNSASCPTNKKAYFPSMCKVGKGFGNKQVVGQLATSCNPKNSSEEPVDEMDEPYANDYYKRELHEVSRKLCKTEDNLYQKSKECEDAVERYGIAAKDLETCKKELDKQKEISSQSLALVEERTRLQKNLDDLQRKNDALLVNLQMQEIEWNNTKKILSENQKQRETYLIGVRQKLEKEISNLRSECEQYKSQSADLWKKIQEISQMLKNAQGKFIQISHTYENDRRVWRDEIKSLTASLEQNVTIYKELEAKSETKAEENDRLGQSLLARNKLLSDLRHRLLEVEGDRNRLSIAKDEERNALTNGLKADLERSNQDVELQRSQNAGLLKSLKSLEVDHRESLRLAQVEFEREKSRYTTIIGELNATITWYESRAQGSEAVDNPVVAEVSHKPKSPRRRIGIISPTVKRADDPNIGIGTNRAIKDEPNPSSHTNNDTPSPIPPIPIPPIPEDRRLDPLVKDDDSLEKCPGNLSFTIDYKIKDPCDSKDIKHETVRAENDVLVAKYDKQITSLQRNHQKILKDMIDKHETEKVQIIGNFSTMLKDNTAILDDYTRKVEDLKMDLVFKKDLIRNLEMTNEALTKRFLEYTELELENEDLFSEDHKSKIPIKIYNLFEDLKNKYEKECVSLQQLRDTYQREKINWSMERQKMKNVIKESQNVTRKVESAKYNCNVKAVTEKVNMFELKAKSEETSIRERMENRNHILVANETINKLHKQIQTMQDQFHEEKTHLMTMCQEKLSNLEREKEKLLDKIGKLNHGLTDMRPMGDLIPPERVGKDIETLRDENKSLRDMVESNRKSKKNYRDRIESILSEIKRIKYFTINSRGKLAIPQGDNNNPPLQTTVPKSTAITESDAGWEKNKSEMEETLGEISKVTNDILSFNRELSSLKAESKNDFFADSPDSRSGRRDFRCEKSSLPIHLRRQSLGDGSSPILSFNGAPSSLSSRDTSICDVYGPSKSSASAVAVRLRSDRDNLMSTSYQDDTFGKVSRHSFTKSNSSDLENISNASSCKSEILVPTWKPPSIASSAIPTTSTSSVLPKKYSTKYYLPHLNSHERQVDGLGKGNHDYLSKSMVLDVTPTRGRGDYGNLGRGYKQVTFPIPPKSMILRVESPTVSIRTTKNLYPGDGSTDESVPKLDKLKITSHRTPTVHNSHGTELSYQRYPSLQSSRYLGRSDYKYLSYSGTQPDLSPRNGGTDINNSYYYKVKPTHPYQGSSYPNNLDRVHRPVAIIEGHANERWLECHLHSSNPISRNASTGSKVEPRINPVPLLPQPIGINTTSSNNVVTMEQRHNGTDNDGTTTRLRRIPWYTRISQFKGKDKNACRSQSLDRKSAPNPPF